MHEATIRRESAKAVTKTNVTRESSIGTAHGFGGAGRVNASIDGTILISIGSTGMRFPFRLSGGVAMLFAVLSGAAVAQPQSSPATIGDRAPLLAAAFDAFLASQGRWACIETHASIGSDGQRHGESILRIDPSQPYAQQIVPLKLNGQAPTEKQIKDWAAHNEAIARQRSENAIPQNSAEQKEDYHLRIANKDVSPLLDRATVIAEDDASVTYAVPMRLAKQANGPLFDTYQLTARVSKVQQQFEHVTLRQQKPYKIGAGTYSGGLIEIDFARPDPRFPAVPVKRTFIQTNKPLFGGPHHWHDVIERTDLRHVMPYDERFGVKIGKLRTLEL